MQYLANEIFKVSSEQEFNDLALKIFQFQYDNISIYKKFVNLLQVDPKKIKNYYEIPFLPISFFKQHRIIRDNLIEQKVFKSSGTTNINRSHHFVHDLSLYEKSFLATFEQFFGSVQAQVILCLLPSYQEQGDSSLLYMTDFLIKSSKKKESGYFLNQDASLFKTIEKLENKEIKYILFGVSYALLDYVEKHKHSITSGVIIETGGMKGRRQELSKEKLHEILAEGFGTSFISSEYGMTELLSQAYSVQNQEFNSPPWMKILIRDTTDPFTYIRNGKTGLLNIIDLANLYSCSFIATDDLGKLTSNGFKVLGRYDNADVRGCNLLVQ